MLGDALERLGGTVLSRTVKSMASDRSDDENEISIRRYSFIGFRESLSKAPSYIATAMIGILIGMTLFDPEPFIKGKSIEIVENLHALVVIEGERNLFTDIANTITEPITRSVTTLDQIESSMNAMSAARAFIGGDRNDYLLVRDGGLTNITEGMIVKSIQLTGDKGVCSARGEIIALFEISRFCGGKYVVLSNERELKYTLSAEMALSLEVSSVSHSKPGYIPKELAKSKGSSAGLPLALSYLDSLTKGSLFSEEVVAATGTLNSKNGLVSEVGGIEYKLQAASESGVDLTIVPIGQELEIKGSSMDVIGVYTVLDAVYILCKRGSNDSICSIFKEK